MTDEEIYRRAEIMAKAAYLRKFAEVVNLHKSNLARDIENVPQDLPAGVIPFRRAKS